MGMKIDDPKLLKLLPDWMRGDEANQALSEAMDKLIKDAGERAKTPRTWDQLENLTDEELDETAWELGIDWWVSSWDRDQKIRTIRMAGSIMEKRGTKWAVEELAKAAFGEGTVEEWFEYGGDPYYFKITTNVPLTPEAFDQLLSMITRVKNVRSHIDTISVDRRIDQTLYTGVAGYQWIKNIILEGSVYSATIDQMPLMTGAFHMETIQNTIVDSRQETDTHNLTVNTGMARNGWTRNTIH